MSSIIDNALEAAVAESIGGQTISKSAGKVYVNGMIGDQQELITDKMEEQTTKWENKQQLFKSATPPVKDTDPIWVSAKKLYDLKIELYMLRLEALKKATPK